ncbi:MAG: chlorhexidine efflux transporter [Bacteroides sp.]
MSLAMGLTLWEAFKLEFAMLVYFFPYTIVFNWLYDKLRSYTIKKLLKEK